MYPKVLIGVAISAAFESINNNQNLFARDTIAGAVAREIRQLDTPMASWAREGTAYKAAWGRKGSNADKHITAAWKDNEIMARFVRHDWYIGFSGGVHVAACRANVHEYTP